MKSPFLSKTVLE
jgi:hypothetical protein